MNSARKSRQNAPAVQTNDGANDIENEEKSIGIRLAKKIAESGATSRRQAEKLIEEGRVSVNGEKILTPVFFVNDGDDIRIDCKQIAKKSDSLRVWKFYKPCNVIVSRHDPQGRKTVFDLLPPIAERLLYIGRLDYNSEGLLLFTNDGNFSRIAELPKTGLKRVYRVRVLGNLSDENIRKIKQNGVKIKGILYKVDDIVREDKTKGNSAKNSDREVPSANSWLKITLSEGKNREIRKIMEYFGCRVNRLIRIEYGGIKLKKMKLGEFKELKSEEVKILKNFCSI